MKKESVEMICLTVFLLTLILFFGGEPDLMDALIKKLGG